MYIGDVGVLGLHWLLRQLLACPQAPRRLELLFEPESIEIAAACVPPSTAPRKPQHPPFLIEVCTVLPLQIDDPPTLAPLELLVTNNLNASFVRSTAAPTAPAIACALASDFKLSSLHAGQSTTVAFSKGVLLHGPTCESSAAADGMLLRFEPDREIFESPFAFDQVCEAARDIGRATGTPTSVRARKTNVVFAYDPKAG